MGYRVHHTDSNYRVVNVENGTTTIVIDNVEESKARDIAKNLNSGGGFSGKIPLFFFSRFDVRV